VIPKKKILILGFLVLLPGVLLSQDFRPELLKMRILFDQEEYEKALSIEIAPGSNIEGKLFYFIKAECAYHQGNIDEAIRFYERVERLDKGAASLELARCWKLKSDLGQMFNYLAEHINSSYKIPRKDIMLDTVFSDLDRDREWIRFWSDRWYDEKDDLLAEANYQIERKDLDKAFWDRLIEKHENDAKIEAILAAYYRLTGNHTRADQSFRNALEIDPDNLEINIQYADYLIENQSYDDAVQLYSHLISSNPYDTRLYLKRVLVLFKSGQTQAGLEEINRIEQLGIDISSLHFLLARELVPDQPALAIEYLDPLLSGSPTSKAFNLRSKAHQAMGNHQKAISDLAMSLDIDPGQADVYFERASLRFDSGDEEGACYDWQNALRLGHRKAADMLYKYCR